MILHVTNADLDAAAEFSDLNAALAGIYRKIDPTNALDLGGEASVWFSGALPYIAPMDNGWTTAPAEEAWPYLDPADRRKRLAQFFGHVVLTHA